MGNIFGILNTGRQAIHVQRSGMSVTGTNIANVNTPGYTRQRAVIEPLTGGGVGLVGVERLRDEFLTARMLLSNGRLGERLARVGALQQLESAFEESDQAGLSRSLQDFFGALQNLSIKPEGTSEREAFLARARQMISGLDGLSGQIDQIRGQLDQQVRQQVERANTITREIAAINQQLGGNGGRIETSQTPGLNQLQDQRDKLIQELSIIVPVRVLTDEHGSVTVMTGSTSLVEGQRVQPLELVPDPASDGMLRVVVQELGRPRDMAASLNEGSLGALLRARDHEAREMKGQVDRLAAGLARDFNLVHRAGTGLDGVSGRDLFSGLQASATAAFGNRGDAGVTSAAIVDPSALNWDDYEIRFTGPSSYDIYNASTRTTVSTGNAWTSGVPIVLAGMSVVLEQGAAAPAAGDAFHVNGYAGMSQRIALDPAVASNPRALAAGQSGAAGDNRNALALLSLRDRPTMGTPPSQTFEGFFTNARVSLATRAEAAGSALHSEDVAQQQLAAMHESVSGVSLDEEATNIIQYQRSFEAASRLVRVTDEMLQTVLNMI